MRTRLSAAAALLFVLAFLELVADEWFPLVISIGLIAAPVLQWRAYGRLRRKHLQDQSIQSLRSAMFTALFLGLASTTLAGIGLYVVFRAFGFLQPLDRPTFLVLLSWPLLLMIGPAIEWLRLRVWPVKEAEG